MVGKEELRIPFICPHCDDDYWVIARRKNRGNSEFTCPNCQEKTELRGQFEVVGPDV
jgi:predicted RNA-binding Zn-ribbon protein involved in translation (DUF1610 family)